MEHHCSKEKQIDKITKLLWEGNGKPPLATMPDQIQAISATLEKIESKLEILLTFQKVSEIEKQNAEKKEKEKLEREKEKKREEAITHRWRIGLTITTILGMITIIISLLSNPKIEKQDVSISEEKFNELWEQYEKEKAPRGVMLADTTLS